MTTRLLVALLLGCAALPASAAEPVDGKAVYRSACAACHDSGLSGAPKLGDAAAWRPRMEQGIGALYRAGVSGKGAMPPKGGHARLSAAEVEAAVNYLVLAADANSARPVVAAARPAPAAKPPGEAGAAQAGATASGAAVYSRSCAACHASGAAGAPKVGDAAAWAPKLRSGLAALQASAIAGKGAMPARGGNASLSDADVRAAVAYMVESSGGTRAVAGAAPSANVATAPAPAPLPVAVTAAATPAPPGVQASPAAAPNAFNRLHRTPGRRNLAPVEDGIHDPAIEETRMLQPPLAAFAGLPTSNAGNGVDWVKALNESRIAPRFDRLDPKAPRAILDLNIVREVKGSMPDVVYPHKQHTQWLDCSNCHPAIFKPQKGANAMSMAAIMLGEQCGVCHGKVAFPVSECRLCHSKNKPPGAATASNR